MAASDTELFFELTNSVFVQSVETPNQIAAPLFYNDDIKPILLKLLRRISPEEVEVVDLTGVTVQIAIGSVGATPTVYTSATSGILDANGFLPISLPFNVAGVVTALGSAAQITPTLELRVVFGANPQRFQTTCTLKQRLITGTLADPAAPTVATSLEEVLSLCVPRNGDDATYPCDSFIVRDRLDSAKKYLVSAENGQWHFELIA